MESIWIIILQNIKKILIAVEFLTILPVTRKLTVNSDDFGKSMAFFPLVGIFIGIFLFFVYLIFLKFLSSLLISVIIVAVWARITGALHLEGFVDAVDGFSASRDKERILEVMKDPNCGSKGAAALVFLIAFKIVIFNDLSDAEKISSLFITPAIGRWSMVCAACFCGYARKNGLGKDFVENVGMTEFLISSLILLLAGCILLRLDFLIIIILPTVFTILAIIFLQRKIDGITGDVLGGLNEIVEVISLFSILLF